MIWAFEIERALFRLFLFLMCAGMLRRVWRSLFTRPPAEVAAPDEWPMVTVQLPIRDEAAVAERVVRAACALDYPKERLEIQVLDDSDSPAVRAQLDALVAELRATGAPVALLRRGERAGFKAGNLAAGLEQARGELIAVLDADAVPPADFLRRTVPALCADPRVGLVQTRQSFLNRDATLLTRVQALLLDALMLVEQPGQSGRGRPFHFNGSAGVWRRACIDEVGGWRGEVSAEDLNLSHRAALAGWRFVHLTSVAVGAELPPTMAALRVQQERWTRGKVEALRRLARPIWRSPLSAGARVDLILPAASRLLFPFLVVLALTMPFTTFDWIHPLIRHSVDEGVGILAVIGGCAAIYYARAAQLAGTSMLGAVALVPAVVALFIGLSLSSTVAWVRGLLGSAPEFAPTPKRGEGGAVSADERLPPRERALAAIEMIVGLGYTWLAAMALGRELIAAVMFFVYFGAAWLWVGGASLERGR